MSRSSASLPEEERARYDAIANIGVVCVVFRLKRSVTPHFWVNIVDPRFRFPASWSSRTCGRPADGASTFPITCR